MRPYRACLKGALRKGRYRERMSRNAAWVRWAAAPAGLLLAIAATAQTSGPSAEVAPAPATASPTLSLNQAIARAMANQPAFAAAKSEQRALALERTNARAALLPSVTYHNEAIYTQANGVPTSRIGETTNAPAPIFIANNSVREYASQAVIDEAIGFGSLAAIHLADANAARAQAELEISRRGLVSAVVALYYGASSGRDKVRIAQRALEEADRFVKITQQREAARQAAHLDVLKAQLQQEQATRQLEEAQLAVEKAKLELGVLLYPDPATPYVLATLPAPTPLPEQAEVDALTMKNNPELRSALASLQVSHAQTSASKAALLPQLGLNFTYGIDATNFGVNGPDGIHNLGYSMSARLDIPVWNWLSSERIVKANHIREGAAKVEAAAAQRQLAANLPEFYAEARTASEQVTSLSESVMIARESLRLTNLRYQDGDSSVLEVVDAQNTLVAAEIAAVDGRVRYQIALANLQTLTGKL